MQVPIPEYGANSNTDVIIISDSAANAIDFLNFRKQNTDLKSFVFITGADGSAHLLGQRPCYGEAQSV